VQERQNKRKRKSERERESEKEKERERKTQRERERAREKERQREKEQKRKREREIKSKSACVHVYDVYHFNDYQYTKWGDINALHLLSTTTCTYKILFAHKDLFYVHILKRPMHM